MHVIFNNQTNAPLTRFAMKFNKNFYGLAPAAPLKVHSRVVLLECVYSLKSIESDKCLFICISQYIISDHAARIHLSIIHLSRTVDMFLTFASCGGRHPKQIAGPVNPGGSVETSVALKVEAAVDPNMKADLLQVAIKTDPHVDVVYFKDRLEPSLFFEGESCWAWCCSTHGSSSICERCAYCVCVPMYARDCTRMRAHINCMYDCSSLSLCPLISQRLRRYRRASSCRSGRS